MHTNYIYKIIFLVIFGLFFTGVFAQETAEKKPASTDIEMEDATQKELINKASYNYHQVEVDQSAQTFFKIYNQGSKDLKIESITNSDTENFTIEDPESKEIKPGKKEGFKIIFHPKSGGFKYATIVITSNDEANKEVKFLVVGRGKEKPGEVAVKDDGKPTIKVTVMVEEKETKETEEPKK